MTKTAAASGHRVPSGVGGKQREAFLALTDEQKDIWLDWYHKNGSPAAVALSFALSNQAMASAVGRVG